MRIKTEMSPTFQSCHSIIIGKCLRVTIMEKGISWDDLTADTNMSTLDSTLTTSSLEDRLQYRQLIMSILNKLHSASSCEAVISLSTSHTNAENTHTHSLQASVLVYSMIEWLAFNYHPYLSLHILLEGHSRSSVDALEREFGKWVRASDVHHMWLTQQRTLFPKTHTHTHTHTTYTPRPAYMWWYEDKAGSRVPYHYDQVMEIEQTFVHIKSTDVFLLNMQHTRTHTHSAESKGTNTDAFNQIIYKEDETNQYKHTSVVSLDCLPVHHTPFDPSQHHMPGYSMHMSAFSVTPHRDSLEGDSLGYNESKHIVDVQDRKEGAEHHTARYSSH
ncbi:hypothetical protein EON65_41575 [archaeon]|nr:MAG: hypothetical protein EON65_41575 [archaeon]